MKPEFHDLLYDKIWRHCVILCQVFILFNNLYINKAVRSVVISLYKLFSFIIVNSGCKTIN